MAIQKTTMKRYNGSEWDPVYLATSADITYLGQGFNVEAGDGFTIGQTIPATENTSTLLTTVINNLTKLDKVTIPALASGDTITALAANKLTGIVARANLPADVGGKGIEVGSEDAKNALTADQVNIGDIVKVTGGKVYLVNAVDPAVTYLELTDSASQIAWSRVTGAPTTLAGYGITDAVNSSALVTVANAGNAGKVLVLNAEGKMDVSITGDAATLGGNAPAYYAVATDLNNTNDRLNAEADKVATLQTEIKAIDAAWITTGTIDIARLPASVLERMYVAENDDALASLTTAQVQNGDTIKVASTGKMYYVTDDSKLGTADYMQGLSEYTAGTASAVDWSGVLNKPTNLAGYGITDAVNANEKVAVANAGNAGKILTINADGKLDASITGDAATLGGQNAAYYAAASDLNDLTGVVGNAASGLVKDVADLQAQMGTGSVTGGVIAAVNGLVTDMTTAKSDITNLKSGEAITALAANKITGTLTRAQLPADISGRLHNVNTLNDAFTTLTADNAAVGDLVKLADGRVYAITNTADLGSESGYTVIVDMANGQLSWNKIIDKPTTLAGYGITDAVNADEKVTTANAANAGKILVLNTDGKLDADITGDAATLGGNAPAYYATANQMTDVGNRMNTAESEIDTLQAEIKAIDAAWITSGVISIDRLPHAALERCVVVADDTARFALTDNEVQLGDTVKVTATNLMYFVKDTTKLNSADGYEVYTAGTAAAVNWSGVTNTPTTLAGYGITDAVNADEKVTTANAANAGKILVLNAEGKLDVDITGSVDWSKILNGPTSTPTQIDNAVAAATHTNRAVLDLLSDVDGNLAYNGNVLATKAALDEVALGALQVVNTGSMPADATAGQLVLESVS